MSRRNRKKKNNGAAPQIKTIRGVTSTGFAFEITKERLENYELLESIAEVDTNPAVLPKVVKLMLGNKSEDLKNQTPILLHCFQVPLHQNCVHYEYDTKYYPDI